MAAKKKNSAKRVTGSFEEAADELEEITRRLEDEPSSLAKLLEDFERGQALLSYCQKTLLSARKRLNLIEANIQTEENDEDSEESSEEPSDTLDDDVRLF
ncbi:MAG: exodeoxyribonuclease VII small subunit [Akkermansiaceae bacterium]|jgi:exodeoxyribonuclease VII small subunit|nr:exodeoxyribonuclease VII small subunit [Akkermansiaceae bacterium]